MKKLSIGGSFVPKCNCVEIRPNGSDETTHDMGFGDIHHHIQMKLIQLADEDLVLVRHVYYISGDFVLSECFGDTSCGLGAFRHGNGSNEIWVDWMGAGRGRWLE